MFKLIASIGLFVLILISGRSAEAHIFDIDGNGELNALTDGLLVLRYLFGFKGSALSENALAQNADRLDDAELQSHLANYSLYLDIDADGQTDALTDGLLFLRYLFGFQGYNLTEDAIGPTATRRAADYRIIETYLNDPVAYLGEILTGGTGHDTLYGDSTNNAIYGFEGNDSLEGGAGNDSLYGGAGEDVLIGGDDDDGLKGGAGDDAIYGGNRRDILFGGAGNDSLYGGDEDDTLLGEAGNDKLDGGDDSDMLTGGDGHDTFVVRSGDGSSGFINANQITDFEGGIDRIELAAGLTFAELSITQGTSGSYTLGGAGSTFYYDYRAHALVQISATAEYLLVIQNIAAGNLSAADFSTN